MAGRSICCLGVLLIGALFVGLTGCSSNSSELKRAITSGKVTFSGKPIKAGQIRFLSVGGPPSQGSITDGVYLINYKGGVAVGGARVEIDAYEATGAEIVIGVGKKEKETIQILPAKFNTKSELKVEIKSGQKNVHDFDLTA